MLCVSLSEATPQALSHRLRQDVLKADVVEVRLDVLEERDSLDLEALIAGSPRPLLFTNRCREEGGLFSGPEEDRVALLGRAALAGATYVDLELRTGPALREALLKDARRTGTRVILSYHDFSGTPSEGELVEVLGAMRRAGADIAKIVTMAVRPQDVHRVLSLYFHASRQDFPLIAFSMGGLGKMSRVACLALGAYLTYASPAEGRETAPGQIPLERFRSIVDYLMPAGK
jgi:3-dehydroquinate dehydratase-1